MAPASNKLISIVIPVLNEEANIVRAYETIRTVFEGMAERYDVEFIFTDNHSTDGTFAQLKALAARDPRVKVMRFNRNYGFQRSVLMGYRHASGAAAIQIDCDLQDPPSLIPKFLDLWERGHDSVVGVRRRRIEPKLMIWSRRAYYTMLNMISDHKLTADAGDFRLIDRAILNNLQQIQDLHPYLRGLTSTLAANEIGLPYDREMRMHEASKFPLRKLVRFALDGIFGHSIVPLRLATYIGLAISVVTCLTGGFYLTGALFFGRAWPSGFATTTVLLLMGISLNALFLGIIGEYISRIYQQVRQHPMVVIEHAINLPKRDVS